jgi:hypothetical protein
MLHNVMLLNEVETLMSNGSLTLFYFSRTLPMPSVLFSRKMKMISKFMNRSQGGGVGRVEEKRSGKRCLISAKEREKEIANKQKLSDSLKIYSCSLQWVGKQKS